MAVQSRPMQAPAQVLVAVNFIVAASDKDMLELSSLDPINPEFLGQGLGMIT
jgi:hypothetical protein